MFPSTTSENFQSWDKFLHAYYTPIRVALGSMPFVGEAQADDVTQSFFLKMYERGFLHARPAITGRFRNWLYTAARRHAIDEWRKVHRRSENVRSFDADAPPDQPVAGSDAEPFNSDEVYALSVLHIAVTRLQEQLIKEGRSDLWLIFDELVIAPLIPGRVAKDREEIRAMFPGEAPGFLDNRLTTVKRIFRRILPSLIPVDPTESLTAEERYRELEEILRGSTNSHLWLALLKPPVVASADTSGSSLDLPPRSSGLGSDEALISRRALDEELRILLGFWIEMPLRDYLDDLESTGPAVAALVRASRLSYDSLAKRPGAGTPFNLNRLIASDRSIAAAIPSSEWLMLLQRIKRFFKDVYRASKQRDAIHGHIEGRARESSIPLEVAHVLYNLVGALALSRCDARIIRIDDDRFRKNLTWVLDQSWLDPELRLIFRQALNALESQPNR